MSTQLPLIDVTSAIVGSTYKMDFTSFNKFNPTPQPGGTYAPAHLQFFNESGCLLSIVMVNSGDSKVFPAGSWGTIEVEPNDSYAQITVLGLIPNPPINTIMGVYYDPSETIPDSYTLGNSPVGGTVTGGSTVGTADHLINTTNAASSSPIINIEETGASGAQMFADNQGNLTVSEYVAGVLTTLLRVIAGVPAGSLNNNVLLGDVSRATQVNGTLQVNGFSWLYNGLSVTAGALSGSTGANAILPTSSSVGYNVTPQAAITLARFFNATGLGNADGNIGMQLTNVQTALNIPSAGTGIDTSGMATGTPFKWVNGQINTANITQTGAGDTQILAPGGVTLNGAVGSATAFEYLRGTVKIVEVIFPFATGFQTGASDIRIQLPVPFVDSAFIWTGGVSSTAGGSVSVQQVAGTDISIRAITALATGAASGTSTVVTTMRTFGYYYVLAPFQYINFKASWPGVDGGPIYIVGS